jgi:adenylate cyclase
MRRHLPLALGVGSSVVAALLGWLGAFQGLDRLLLDMRIAARAEPDLGAHVGIVVAADDDLEGPAELGMRAWPWDRDLHGQVVSFLREAGASAVGLDFLLDGAGRSAAGDAALAEAAKSRGHVVVGATFDLQGPRGVQALGAGRLERHSLPAPGGSRFPMAARCLLPYDDLGDAAAAVAFLNSSPEGDGKTRRVWLLLEYQGRLFPSFALATYLVHVGKSLVDVEIDDDGNVRIPRADGSHVRVPLDGEGRMLLDPAKMETVPVRAYLDVFARYVERGAEGLEAYSDRPVLVGHALTGSSDIQASSREPHTYGVFLQAAALAQLIEARFLHEGSLPGRWVVIVVLCVGAAWAGGRLRGPWQVAPAVLVLALPIGLAFVLARASGYVPPLGTLLAGGFLAWASAATLHAVADGRQRRRVEAVFQGFLPRAVLAEVLSDPAQRWTRPERREGVLLLARLDRRDAGRLAPEEEAALLDDLLGAAVEALVGAGGTVVRLDLDRMAAVFGAPTEMQEPGRAALHAALSLRGIWRQANTRWIDRLGAPFSGSFALHAGVLSLGCIGTERHREYSVFGPEVAAAQAVLAQAAPGQVLLSERFQALVGAAVETTLVGQVADGRGVYEVMEFDPAP